QLKSEIGRWDAFADQAADRLVRGRLAGVPVVSIFVEGTDRGSFDALQQTVASSGATLVGTVTLTAKLALRSNDDVTALRVLADAAAASPADLRRIVAAQVAAAVATKTEAAPLAALTDKGFVRLQAQTSPPPVPAALAVDGARFVVVADSKA